MKFLNRIVVNDGAKDYYFGEVDQRAALGETRLMKRIVETILDNGIYRHSQFIDDNGGSLEVRVDPNHQAVLGWEIKGLSVSDRNRLTELMADFKKIN